VRGRESRIYGTVNSRSYGLHLVGVDALLVAGIDRGSHVIVRISVQPGDVRIVTVRSAQVVRPIQFVGEGKVVRVDPQAAQEVFAIAVECARPITRIDHYLEATGS
jgi:hypothetical protein